MRTFFLPDFLLDQVVVVVFNMTMIMQLIFTLGHPNAYF